MIMDANLILSENQAITATAISANVINWPALSTVYGEDAPPVRNLGAGNPLPLLIQATEDFATLTSLTITLETADNDALSSGAVVLGTTPAIAVADLTAGWRTTLPFIPDATMKRYFGLRFTVAGSNATAGRITAAVGTAVDSN